MKRFQVGSLASLVVLLLAPAHAADPVAEAARTAVRDHKGSLVRVQARVWVQTDRLPGVSKGTRRTHEVSIPGLVVSDDGLVIFPARSLDPAAASFALLGATARAEVGHVSVAGSDGRIREAAWVGRSAKGGFAFVRVAAPGRKGLTPVRWDPAVRAQLAQRVLLLSLTSQLLGHAPRAEVARVSFVAKTLSGVSRASSDALGALVVGDSGKVLGIFSHALPLPRGGGLLRPDRVAAAQAGYLVPAKTLLPLIKSPPKEIPTARTMRARPWLGIKHQVLTPDLASTLGLDVDVGIHLVAVYDGPAKVAGLQKGDVLLKLDGEPLDLDPGESFDDLIQDYVVGEEVALLVRRKGKNKTVTVKLGRGPVRPEDADHLRVSELGLTLRGLTFFDRREHGLDAETGGAVLVDLEADGAGSRAGLRSGDLILQVDGEAVQGLRDLQRVLLRAGVHQLQVRRKGRTLTLRVRS